MEQVEQKHAEELGKKKKHFNANQSRTTINFFFLCDIAEQRGSSNEESKEALEQSYEEKLQSIEIQHQSQLSKISPCIIFTRM